MKFKDYLFEIQSKPIFLMLIGISGSGKSTFAESFIPDFTIMSSDAMRLELWGDANDQREPNRVFEELHKRTVEKLKNGKSVIYDATNLSIKDRNGILQKINNISCHKIAYVFSIPVELCKAQNKQRERQVPERIIDHQVKKFQFPLEGEGFDKIWVDVFDKVQHPYHLRPEMVLLNFDQKNKWHKHSLFIHSALVVENANQLPHFDDAFVRACWYHDFGKLYTQELKDDGSGDMCYHNHANLGAYILMIGQWQERTTQQQFIDIITLINYHMYAFDWKTEAIKKKYKKLLGGRLYNQLMILHEADKKSSQGD